MLIRDAIKHGYVQLDTGARFDDQVNVVELEDDGRNYGTILIGCGSIIRAGAIICSGAHIGARSMVGHNCVVRARVRIGDETVISHLVNIERDTVIGSGVRISAHTHLTGGCLVEDDAHIGANVATINDRNLERKAELRAPIFRQGSRIGSSVTVMANVEIGPYALIGAGSLVLANIPAHARAYGTPAVIRS